ncbi:hypothetical protein [Saccharopolyspora pogona]|uniref:hypothetical protein n=1 Tax=Saccharopolyspora pogona TaxID=333966 RepID=UPI001688AD16|nr:hypothetical protein [Saccharopolyspora pogona]
MYFLNPWSAINLVDFYFLRKENYDLDASSSSSHRRTTRQRLLCPCTMRSASRPWCGRTSLRPRVSTT